MFFMKINIKVFYKLIQRGIVVAPGTVYEYKNHTKISREFTTKKRWFGTNLCHTHTKISDARTIKKLWLRTKTGAVYAYCWHLDRVINWCMSEDEKRWWK